MRLEIEYEKFVAQNDPGSSYCQFCIQDETGRLWAKSEPFETDEEMFAAAREFARLAKLGIITNL